MTGLVYYELTESDALSRDVSAHLGNGLDEVRAFDRSNGRLASIETGPSLSATIQDLAFVWDEVGNLEERTDHLITKTEQFDYDALNRLTVAQVQGLASVTLAYSPSGRILSKDDVGSYSYADPDHPYAVTSAGAVSYDYDANGQMTDHGGDTFTWYANGSPDRLHSGNRYEQFYYGADGSLSRRTYYDGTDYGTTDYAGALFERVVPSGWTLKHRHYVQARGRVVAMVESVGATVTAHYLHRDHQGSVVEITDAAGALEQSLAFDPWGLRREPTTWLPYSNPFQGTHVTERGYTGHEHLDNVELIHMGGRVQDPVLGSFISPDPIVQAPYSSQSHNRYSYVWNNPTSNIDPTGFRKACTVITGDDTEFAACTEIGIPGGCDLSCAEAMWWSMQLWQLQWQWLQWAYDVYSSPGGYYGGPVSSPGTSSPPAQPTEAGQPVPPTQPAQPMPQGGSLSLGPINISWTYRDNFAGRMLQSGDAASIGVGVTPAGFYADVYTAVSGEDYFTGEEVSGFWRAAGLLPLASELRKGRRVADAVDAVPNGPPSNAPDFIVSPGGTAFPVPRGATGPTPVINPTGRQTGSAFTGGRGGANQQVDALRVMDPTPPRGSSPGYPRGYIKYENSAGQGVDPYTGRTVPNSQSHFPID